MFGPRLQHPTSRAIDTVQHSPPHVTVIAIAVVILLVIAIKARFGTGTPLRGGLPSGHAAVAFGGWAAVTFITQSYENQVLVSTLVFMMALLVAQTRVEAQVHTTLEVLYGGVLGAMVTPRSSSFPSEADGCRRVCTSALWRSASRCGQGQYSKWPSARCAVFSGRGEPLQVPAHAPRVDSGEDRALRRTPRRSAPSEGPAGEPWVPPRCHVSRTCDGQAVVM